MFARSIISAVLLCATVTAHAEEIIPWNFRGNMPRDAQTTPQTTAEITEDGLRIATEADGYIVWGNGPMDGPTDVITIRAAAAKDTEGSVLWQEKGATPDQLIQAYFRIPGDGFMHDVHVIVSSYPQWNWQTDQFALAFPAGSDVIIEEIQFRHWTIYERITELWRSFWTFDSFRSYSINFLWGPLIATNSVLRTEMFESLPPLAWAIGRVLYPLFFAVAIVCWIVGRMKRNGNVGLGLFMIFFSFCWLVFDIRMGSEIMSYAITDIRAYVLADDDQKKLRAFDSVYAKANALFPHIREHETFTLLSPVPSVYYPVFRYNAYPSVIVPDPAGIDVPAWVVIDRPDLEVDDAGYLRVRGAVGTGSVIAGPGTVTATFNDQTFLFVVTP